MSKVSKADLIKRMDDLLAERGRAVDLAWSINSRTPEWQPAMDAISAINDEMHKTADAISPRCKHWGASDCYHFYGIKPMAAA